MADASMLLAGSLDNGETLRQLAHAIVPRFVDRCTMSLRQEDGVVRRIIGVHKDPACDDAGQATDKERAAAAGFDHHLVEPVDVATIRRLLDAALVRSSGIPGAG